jgi:hypothetical protein
MLTVHWNALLKVLAPIILGLIPQIPKALIPVIVEGINTVEIPESPGAEKLHAVVSHPDLTNVELPALVDGINATILAVNEATKVLNK